MAETKTSDQPKEEQAEEEKDVQDSTEQDANEAPENAEQTDTSTEDMEFAMPIGATSIPPEVLMDDDIEIGNCYACGESFEEFYYLGQKYGFDLIGCLKCGSVVIDPYPTPEILEKYYTDYKGTTDYESKKDKKITRCSKRIKKLMSRTEGKRFLDVGCNHGFAVAAANELGLEAFGIDVDPSAIEYAQENFGKDKFKTISVEDYAKEGNKADIIYTSEVIEHLYDPESFVKALKEILSPDGIIYLTTPDGNHFMIPNNFPSWKAVIPPEHIHYFSRDGLKIMFERAGLKVDKFFFNFKPGIRMIASHAGDKK